MGKLKSRFFIPEDATRMIPLLKAIVGDIVSRWEIYLLRKAELQRLKNLSRAGERIERLEIRRVKEELSYLLDKIADYEGELEELGCVMEEYGRGIINFPSFYDGRKVFLCWRYGEERIRYWHELDEGCEARVEIRDYSKFLVRE